MAIVLSLLVASNAAARDLYKKRWIEVTTPNFTILSTHSKIRTVRAAEWLEVMHGVAGKLLNVRQTNIVPTLILYLDRREFERFTGQREFAGFFRAGIRYNLIVSRDEQSGFGGILMHEYIHYLTYNSGGAILPRWYKEGLARYFENVYLHGGEVTVGIPSYLWKLPREYSTQKEAYWLSAEQLLKSNAFRDLSGEEIGKFYTQSWLLVHYLQHSRDRQTTLADSLANYTALVSSGKDEIASFTEAFGIAPEDLGAVLTAHVDDCCNGFRIPEDEVLTDFEPGYRKLTREEAALALVEAYAMRGNYEQMETTLPAAMAGEQTRSRALLYQADLSLSKNKPDEALSLLEESAALAPEDPIVLLSLGQHWLIRASAMNDEQAVQEAYRNAETSLVNAWKRDKQDPEIYQWAGLYYLQKGDNPARAIEMLEQSYALAPGISQTKLYLAQAYEAAGRVDDATRHAREILAWPHIGSANVDKAIHLLERIDAKERDAIGDH